MFLSRSLAALLSFLCLVLGAQNGTTPMQIRLAYAGETGMMVSWNTYDHLDSPTVYYGMYVKDAPPI